MHYFFLPIAPPTIQSPDAVVAHARVNVVRTAKQVVVGEVQATASVPAVASAGNINQVTVNPVPAIASIRPYATLRKSLRIQSATAAHAKVPTPSTVPIGSVVAHAKVFAPSVRKRVTPGRVAAHAFVGLPSRPMTSTRVYPVPAHARVGLLQMTFKVPCPYRPMRVDPVETYIPMRVPPAEDDYRPMRVPPHDDGYRPMRPPGC